MLNSNGSVSLDGLVGDPTRVASLENEQVSAVLTQIAALQSALAARLLQNGGQQNQAAPDKMLTVEEAAALIHETPDWIKRHAKRLRCVVRPSRNRFLVSENGLNRWLASRKA